MEAAVVGRDVSAMGILARPSGLANILLAGDANIPKFSIANSINKDRGYYEQSHRHRFRNC